MRISTGQLYDRSIQAVLDNQGDLSDVQTQLASGKKLLRPSDDPVGAAQVLRLTEEIDLISQYKKNSNILTNNLEQEETILGSITNSVNRARVLMIEAGNGIVGIDDRRAIATEIAQIRDQVFDLMNTRNAVGEYIFAGTQSASPAFVLNQSSATNKYSFQGDAGTNKIQISGTMQLQVNNSGQAVFEDVLARLKTSISSTSGLSNASLSIDQQGAFDIFHQANYDAVTPANNQYQVNIISANQVEVSHVASGNVLETIDFASGVPFSFRGINFELSGVPGDSLNFQLDPPQKQNIAETLNNFVLALTNSDISQADYDEALQDALIGVDNSLVSIGDATSVIGGRLNVNQAVLGANLDLEIANKTARASIEEVDYAEAVSELSRQEAALEAALATFARVTGTSLFDFIR